MTRIITLSTGQSLTLRPMTEAEAIAFADKRTASASATERLADATDDGDEEILACVTAGKAELLTLLDDYPDVTRLLGQALREMGGDSIELAERPVTEEEKAAHPGKRLIGLRTPGVFDLLCQKLSRMDYKFLRQEPENKAKARITWASFSRKGKAMVLAGGSEELWQRLPFLSQNLGMVLYQKASVKIEATEGK